MKNPQRVKEIELQIEGLYKELEQLKTWTTNDIKPGIVVKGDGHDKCLVIQAGYNKDEFYLGGLWKDPFGAFSNGPYTKQKLADHFNRTNHRLLGTLETNFEKLG